MSETFSGTVSDVDLERARTGDDAAFGRVVAPLRRELHAHCYRMLGSSFDADDALQEALVRAWRGLARFEGRSSVRTWLYTVATRTCLDSIDQRAARALPMDLGPASPRAVVGDAPVADVAWLGPYPDSGLGGSMTPEARYEQREAVELAFVAALQHLPGNQRAALVLFEVLGFAAADIAMMMETSTASVNSALQRARSVVAQRVPSMSHAHRPHGVEDARIRDVAARYAAALELGDADALVALLTADVTWSMPPLPHWYSGIDAVRDFAVQVPLARCGAWKRIPVAANGQPAMASYIRGDDCDEHRPFAIDVLSFRGDHISAITTFIGAEHFRLFGLPARLA